MKVTALTRRTLEARREARDYTKAGWEKLPVPIAVWKDGHVIADVAIGADKKTIWIKTERKRK